MRYDEVTIYGITVTGNKKPFLLNEDGSLIGSSSGSTTTGTGSSTGAGDASAANQVIEIARLTEIRDKLGSGGAKKFDPETLTAPGISTALDVFTIPYTRITCQLDISNLTSFVVCRLEGSNTGANYVNLDPNEENTTISANGIYMFSISDICLFRARFNFISGAATILINTIASV